MLRHLKRSYWRFMALACRAETNTQNAPHEKLLQKYSSVGDAQEHVLGRQYGCGKEVRTAGTAVFCC